jgi:kynurenine formamidase
MMDRPIRLFALGLLVLFAAWPLTPAQPEAKRITADMIATWMKELSNWGRWGKDDERGAMNLVTPASRRAALALVRDGVSVSLARDVETTKAADNPNPFEHTMLSAGMDRYAVSYHGFAHTHLDSLCHFAYSGRLYNGFPQTSAESGCEKLSVENFKDGIVTRGVLVDLAWLDGVDFLSPDRVIYPEDLDRWEKTTGVEIRSGDAVLFRTGRWARRAAQGAWNIGQRGAGLHASCARWLKERDVALVGSDFGTDVQPSGIEGVRFPMHTLLIVAMGTPLIDNADLEALSIAARERGRWEFLLTAAPLAVPGGTGSPLNPTATF